MNPKIESDVKRAEFSPEFIQVLIALTGATLLLVFVFEHVFKLHTLYERYFFTPFPWIIAAGLTIADGLSKFSGEQPAVVSQGERLAVLANFLIIYVVAPTMFFFGWRHRRLLQDQGEGRRTLWTFILIVGGMLTFSAVIPAIPAAIAQRAVSTSLRDAQAVQGNKDLMINDLNVLAWSARQYKILPKSLGGGGGSFVGYSPTGEIASTEEGTYSVEASANVCSVNARSKKYPYATIRLIIDERGKLQKWNYGGPFE
ncbi:MAG: hypothetical protein HYY49_12000 [Ignavibacteriales bacterium]|nr:hypothetical protein [Ignavibacteriales bacterium]